MLKQAIKVGNGAGVLLPRKYLGNLIEIKIRTLTKEDIKKQILSVVYPYLKNIMGIYLVGSYARNEECVDSDVDVVIVSNKNIKLELENYHLICLTYRDLARYMERSIIEYYPMLLEAETILNEDLLQKLLETPITKKSLKWHLESCKSALKVVEKALLTEDKDLIVNDAILYSLILRLREIYLVDCILNRKIGSLKGLIKYARRVKPIERLCDLYRELRSDGKIRIDIGIEEIRECYEFTNEKLKSQEKKIDELGKEKKAIREKN